MVGPLSWMTAANRSLRNRSLSTLKSILTYRGENPDRNALSLVHDRRFMMAQKSKFREEKGYQELQDVSSTCRP